MTPLSVKDLLLAADLEPAQVSALLRPFGFRDTNRADAGLQSMAGNPAERQLLADILDDLLHAVAQSADPDQALTYMDRFASAALNKTRLYTYLKEAPRTLEILAKTMGGSAYMAEILIRDPHHFYWVTDPAILERPRRKREIQKDLVRTLRMIPDEAKRLDYLRAVKRREMLHIGVRDLLRLCTVQQTLDSLSILAQALISGAYSICSAALHDRYEIPSTAFTGFTVIAMGKLGGGELNFSSDVDLLYVYKTDDEENNGWTAEAFFRRLSQKVTAALNDLTGEGYVYRVDLRLRPEGLGDIADTLDRYARYYDVRGSVWERLALLKASPVAGDRNLGSAFVQMAANASFGKPFDSKSLEEVRSMKRKIEQKMVQREQQTRNVKLGTGGIREIELIAQSFQAWHGAAMPQIRQRNTLKALDALCVEGLITSEECETLTRAYIFLRDVENKLQMVNDAQTHSLPRELEQLRTCARLLGYTDGPSAEAAEQFMEDYRARTSEVSRIFDKRILSGQL